MQSILIVDDLESIHEMLDSIIQPIGYATAFATNGEIALQKIRENKYDIILTDIAMKPMDGITLLAKIKEADPDAIVIMMSGYADVDNASQALKLGAFDYLTKPFRVDQLMAAIQRAAAEGERLSETVTQSNAQTPFALSIETETSNAFQQRLEQIAQLPAPLLINGESGTQKTLFASFVHSKSQFANGPLVTFNAREADSDEYEKLLGNGEGAYGPTVLSSKGGSLHLAHIEAVPQEHQIPLGNLIRDLKGSARVICSTSADLEKDVEAGKFADALYFRIANNAITLPTLRDRLDEIQPLALSFFAQHHHPITALDEAATQLLQSYSWPGNYVEFQETLAAAAAISHSDTLQLADLPEQLSETKSWPTLEEHLTEQAERYKRQILRACQGDTARATQILGCDPSQPYAPATRPARGPAARRRSSFA